MVADERAPLHSLQAQAAGLAAVRDGYENSTITSTTGETYPEYYGKAWDANAQSIAAVAASDA